MKASEILLSDTIRHDTRQGYKLGCRGSHCPGTDTLGMTCKEAFTRYASDFSYRRRIDNGLSPEAIAAEDMLDGQPTPPSVAAGVQRHEVFGTIAHGRLCSCGGAFTVENLGDVTLRAMGEDPVAIQPAAVEPPASA